MNVTAEEIAALWAATEIVHPENAGPSREGTFGRRLAKFANAILATFAAPRQSEIQKRERDAFRQGFVTDRTWTFDTYERAARRAEELYPLPDALRRVVKLSGGHFVRKKLDGNGLEWTWPKPAASAESWHYVELDFTTGHGWTAQDIEAIYSLLKEEPGP